MPIFEFRCDRCEKTFEDIVNRTVTRLNCPKCGRDDAVNRLMSAFSFKSSGKFQSSEGSTCGSCTTHNCSHCHG